MKKLTAIVAAMILVAGLSTTAFAARRNAPICAENTGYGYGCGGYGIGFMCDENGNLLDREALSEKLDGAVADGLITEEARENILAMYDACQTYTDRETGGRRGGCCRG